jgi:hypothetical protein
MQPTPHPTKLQPPLTPKRRLTVGDLEDVTIRVVRVAEFAPAVRASAGTSTVIAAESKRLRRTANAYIDRRLSATQRVAEFQGCEHLFSLWHALHIPLIFMLISAAVVHVTAVNVY